MATPTVWLSDFQVNTGTANTPSISDPQTIGLSNGNILVAWAEFGTTGVGTAAGLDIVGKIYDGAGNLVRDSYRINFNYSADEESDFDIAPTNDGGFILVYIDNDGANSRVAWERKNAAGNNINSQSIVSETNDGDFDNPQIAVNNINNTSFLTFTDYDLGGIFNPDDDDVRGIRLSSSGTVLTAEFDAGDIGGSDEDQNDVAINVNGEMVSVYRDEGEIKVSVLNTAGTVLHTAVVDSNGSPRDPQVATLSGGNIVVTWTDDASGGSLGDVNHAVFNSNLGVVLSKTGIDNVDANESEVIALPQNEYIVVWDDDSANNDIKARKFNADGTADGGIVTVQGAGGNAPNVGVTGDGRVIFVYENSDNVRMSIWDPRDGSIVASNYDNPQENFVDGDIIWAKTTGGSTFGDNGTADHLIGLSGNDYLRGYADNDTLEGNGGNDILQGDLGNDSMDGGIGNDAFYYNAGATGTDTIIGGAGFDNITTFNTGTTDLSAAGTQWSGLERFNFVATDATPGNKTAIIRGDEYTDGFVNGMQVVGQSNTALREILQVNMSVDISIDMSNTTFAGGWTDGLDYIRIEGDVSSESIIGTTGSDYVAGNGGNDDFLFTTATVGLEETVIGGDGNDEILINGAGLFDFSNVGTEFNGIEEIRFGAFTSTVRLGSDEIDSSFELDDVIIDGALGGGNVNTVEVVMNTNSVDLSAWAFQDWDPSGEDEFITITGDTSSETITGSIVRDNIITGFGNDTVDAGAGNDTITATGGSNNLDGGADDDLFVMTASSLVNQTVEGGLGDDTIDFSGVGGDNPTFVTGFDLDEGFSSNGAPYSGDWNGLENLTGILGYRNDIIGNSSANELVGGTLGDTITGESGNDTLLGLGGNDSLLGDSGVDSIVGGAGDDTIDGGFDVDEVSGGLGNDVFQITGNAFGDNIDGGGDTDTLDLSGWTFSSIAWDVNLALETYEFTPNSYGANGMYTLENVENVIGSDFNDSIVGAADDNLLSGGLGADTIFGYGGADTISGNGGADEVRGNAGADIIGGEGGNDAVFGGEGDDSLYGGAGNDTLSGGADNDLINGGANFDIVDYSDATTDLVVNINFAGAQTVSAQMGTDTFVSIEGINGGSANDLLVGSSAGDVINGGAGNDEIYGIGAGDVLNGGIGADQIEGSGGNDTMDGGAGDADILSYYNSAGAVAVDLRFQGTAQAVGGSSGTDTFTGFEDLFGSNAAGTDILIGNNDDSRILGFNGDDRLFGFDGDDDLIGMQGNDSLAGGVGEDTLSGGGGADAFLFNDVLHSTGADRDTITDFGVGGADKIDLSMIDANTSAGGNQAFNFVGSAGFGSAGDLRFATNGTNGFVLGDVDGDGNADLNILLLGVTSMTAGDFVL